MTKNKYDFDHTTSNGQKRLMAFSVGLDTETYIEKPIISSKGDYGCDPIENNMYKMVPSGDILNYDEKEIRLGR